MKYSRKNIEAMAAYVPGEQPAPGQKVVKLNTNENPYPPSPKALAAVAGAGDERLRRYPDPLATARACRSSGSSPATAATSC